MAASGAAWLPQPMPASTFRSSTYCSKPRNVLAGGGCTCATMPDTLAPLYAGYFTQLESLACKTATARKSMTHILLRAAERLYKRGLCACTEKCCKQVKQA